jgi:hypothetical protein
VKAAGQPEIKYLISRQRRLAYSAMGAFIATLAAEHLANWDICKKELLWGVPHSGHAENAARQVTPGVSPLPED